MSAMKNSHALFSVTSILSRGEMLIFLLR